MARSRRNKRKKMMKINQALVVMKVRVEKMKVLVQVELALVTMKVKLEKMMVLAALVRMNQKKKEEVQQLLLSLFSWCSA